MQKKSDCNVDLNNEFFQKASSLRQKWFDAYWRVRYQEEAKPSRFTLMHLLAESGLHQVMEKFLHQSCWADEFNSRDSLGNIPLHWASRNGHLKVVEMLLTKTDNLEMVNFNEMTPLNLAAHGGHIEIVMLLIREGAKINSKARRHATTVLQNAASNGHEEIVRILLDDGADVDARDMDGNTAQSLAKMSGHSRIVNLLQEFESKRLAKTPSSHSQRVDGSFLGIVIDVLHPASGRYFYKRVTVDRMLSEEKFDKIMGGAKGGLVPADGVYVKGGYPVRRGIRWMHLPANNVGHQIY
jgi:Ankyrin repeats (3 copies)